jgi:hypothetical protein
MPDRIWAWEYFTFEEGIVGGYWKHENPSHSNPSEYIRADLVPTWQPIETAPKDQSVVLLHSSKWLEPCSGYFISAKYLEKEYGNPYVMEEGWYPSCGFIFDLPEVVIKPTHWMPLPEAPKKG